MGTTIQNVQQPVAWKGSWCGGHVTVRTEIKAQKRRNRDANAVRRKASSCRAMQLHYNCHALQRCCNRATQLRHNCSAMQLNCKCRATQCTQLTCDQGSHLRSVSVRCSVRRKACHRGITCARRDKPPCVSNDRSDHNNQNCRPHGTWLWLRWLQCRLQCRLRRWLMRRRC